MSADIYMQNAAGDLNTPPTYLFELANHPDGDVRYWAAWNPSMPVEGLFKLAGDESFAVRHGVARNPNTPISVLIKLAEDKSKEVIYWVVRHPNCTDIMRAWIKMGGFAGMTLAEFMAVTETS